MRSNNLKLPILVSYPYMNHRFVKRLAEARDGIEFFLDSGAFTAWNKGRVIALDDYCGFIDGLPFAPDRMMMLDVIGDADRTRQNFETMLDRGYRVVPIVTRGESPEVLKEFYAKSDLIALGGVTGTDHGSAAWFRAMMGHVGQRHAHILGMTRLEWVKLLRPWSVDSSSWLSAARYGTVNVYMGHGRFAKYEPRHDGKPDPRIAARIRRYGIDPYELGKAYAGVGNNSLWQTVSTMGWIEYGFEQRANIGTRLFLAMTTEHWFDHLWRAFNRYGETMSARGT